MRLVFFGAVNIIAPLLRRWLRQVSSVYRLSSWMSALVSGVLAVGDLASRSRALEAINPGIDRPSFRDCRAAVPALAKGPHEKLTASAGRLPEAVAALPFSMLFGTISSLGY